MNASGSCRNQNLSVRLSLWCMVRKVVHFLQRVIDWFYPPFRRIMPIQTFRYAACGGGNTLLDFVLFVLVHDVIFEGKVVATPIMPLSAYNAAFFISFSFTFPIGFFLSRYVVFQEFTTRKREQLPKYLMVVVAAILINLFCFFLFVKKAGLNPILAKLVIVVIVVLFSYYSQRYFTFKGKSDLNP
jgi:putative flippase GtrA